MNLLLQLAGESKQANLAGTVIESVFTNKLISYSKPVQPDQPMFQESRP